jgi:hypothetical protein
MKNTPYYFDEDDFFGYDGEYYVPDFYTMMKTELSAANEAKRAEEYIKNILLSQDKIEIKTLQTIINECYPHFKHIFDKYSIIS